MFRSKEEMAALLYADICLTVKPLLFFSNLPFLVMLHCFV